MNCSGRSPRIVPLMTDSGQGPGSGHRHEAWPAGVVLLDKPCGMTSFAVIRRVRRLCGVKKVGHAGTLDPFASGLLVVCIGRAATRHVDRFMGGRKVYRAGIRLGVETSTLDPEGEVVRRRPVPELSGEDISSCLKEFVGPRMQAPPAFSAAKHKGKPLYHYARQGIEIKKDPRPIEIYSLRFLGYDAALGRLECELACSRGTYVRVLAAEIGERLGCGAHLETLRRTASGGFSVRQALAVEDLAVSAAASLLRSAMMDVETALARGGEKAVSHASFSPVRATE